ncbi:MAG: rod shape-determining protein MreC [bacterium]|nr:rod shape-determining protein MreC [bacterium]
MFRKSNHARYKLHPHSLQRAEGSRITNGLSGVLLFGLVLIAIMLLVLGKSNNLQLKNMRSKALDLTSPLLQLANLPASYIQRSIDRLQNFYENSEKLHQLRLENKRLQAVKWDIARLEQNNTKLKALLNSAREPRLKFVSGRIISGNPALFGQHMLVNVGRRNGVHAGFAVINADGFIGRTFETAGRTSRILLITDKSSRIPIKIGKQGIRGIATGTGSHSPKIDFLPHNASIYEGDLVFTSGHGGDLPKGLRIGVIRKIGDKYHIALSAKNEGTEYVSILYFKQPGLARRN